MIEVNKMKTNVIITISTLVFIILFSSEPIYGLRCNGRLVEVGDTKSQVVDKCGEPDHIEMWQEEKIVGRHFHRQGNSCFFL